MKLISPDFDNSSKTPLYIQLYNYLKGEIMTGGISSGEKLPSLRKLAKQRKINNSKLYICSISTSILYHS